MTAVVLLALWATGSTLEDVRLTRTEHGARVVLAGTAAPNFTAFFEREPDRIVVDWAGSRVGAIPSTPRMRHPDVRAIRVEERANESEVVTRVSIVLARSVPFELRSEDTEVWVELDVDPARIARVDAPAGPPDDDEGPPAPPPAARDRPLRERSVSIPAVASAPEIPDAEPTEVVSAADLGLPPPTMEPERRAALDRAELAAVAPPGPSTEPDPAASPAPPTPVAALAPPPPRRLAQLAPPEPLPEPGPEPEPEPAAESAPSPEPPAPLARFTPSPAPSAAPPRPKIPGRAPAPAPSPRAAPDRPAEPVVLARYVPARGASDAAARSSDETDPGPHTMTYIGFRQRGATSRVFMRLDGRARFRQFQEGSTFVLELVDTSVNVKNNERPLDTTYFQGPVLNVRARPVRGSTRIEVKLRTTTPWQIKRIGNTIAIDFQH